jgi:SAM-dependent methyltransferase
MQMFAPTSASFVCASALDLPFADQQFDIVTMFDVIEHVPRGRELGALREARRVLLSAGRMAVSTPGRSWFATYTDPAFYFGHRHYRARDLRRLLDQSGLQVLELRTGGGIFDQLDLLLYYAARHLAHRERHPFAFIRSRAEGEWLEWRGDNTILVIARRP